MKKYIIGFIIFLVGFVIGKAVDAAGDVTGDEKFTITSCATSLDMETREVRKNGWAFWFVRKELSGGLNVKMSQVGPQQALHGAHTHDENEVFYILHGEAEFTLNDDKTLVGKNSTLFCPGGVPHGIRNAGTDSLRYLVIKNN